MSAVPRDEGQVKLVCMATSIDPEAPTLTDGVNSSKYVACALGVMVEGIIEVDENAPVPLYTRRKVRHSRQVSKREAIDTEDQ